MGRRPSFDDWHNRRLELDDGDVLTWVIIDNQVPPRIEAFRLASRGAIHRETGMALLQARGHPDATLRLPSLDVRPGLTH